MDGEDSDQTGRIPRLILVFAGHTRRFVGFVTMRLISFLYVTRKLSYKIFIVMHTLSCLQKIMINDCISYWNFRNLKISSVLIDEQVHQYFMVCFTDACFFTPSVLLILENKTVCQEPCVKNWKKTGVLCTITLY